jgi:hypothetical protein
MSEQERAWLRVEQAAHRLADAERELEHAVEAAARERATERPRLRLLLGGADAA